MTHGLAAAAADVELTSGGDVADWLRDAANGDEANPLAVRDALLELAALQRDADEIAGLKAQIAERYDEQIWKKRDRIEAIRDSLTVYAQRFGKVSFPDVGGIHLTTRKAKLTVRDAARFEDFVTNVVPKIKTAAVETVERWDYAAALELVLDEYDATVTAEGSIVNTQTGEDLTDSFDAWGIEAVAEAKTLAVRKS